MADLPLTTTQLLDRLKGGTFSSGAGEGAGAWAEVDARYRPVLIGFTRSLGLGEADAEDAAQWTLAELSRALRHGQYERGKGRLRSWIMGIARNRVLMIQRAARRREARQTLGDVEAGAWPPTPPDDETMSAAWDRELERAVFTKAWELVRSRFEPGTIRAFELVAMRGLAADVVAAECGVTAEQVYVAKSRVTKALRELTAELMARYGEDE